MSTLASNLHSYEQKDKEWKEKYYSFLKGARIVKVEVFEDDLFTGSDKNWVALTIEKADGVTYEVQLSRDEEGNGPGFMFGLPRVTV